MHYRYNNYAPAKRLAGVYMADDTHLDAVWNDHFLLDKRDLLL